MGNILVGGFGDGPRPRQPMVVHCAGCEHEWAPLFAPAPLDLVSKLLKKAKCPNCGKHPHFMGFVVRDTKPGDMMGWLHNGDTGVSSLTLWHAVMLKDPRPFIGPTPGQSLGGIPGDAEDFGRCYRMLQVETDKTKVAAGLLTVAKAYDRWAPIAQAWDELTVLYEEEEPTGQAPKLCARLKELAGPRRASDPVDGNDEAAVEAKLKEAMLAAALAAAVKKA
jgi:hypothetical protein